MSEKFPIYKVKCSRCGKEKFTNENAYLNRIKKFGSKEEMEKNWKCRECTNELKHQKEQ